MNGSEKNNSGSQFMTVVGKLGLKNKSLSKKKTADSLLQANKLEIWTVDNKIIPVDLNRIRLTKGKETDVLVRDVVRDACRQLNIYPKTSTFFGLSNENNWLIQTKRIDTINSKYWNKLVLTLQFKVLSSNELRKFDETAYLYYVKQCRYIFKNGLLQRQLESRENEKILLRMVILEMMMVAKEENVLPLKDVLKSKNKKIFNLDEIVKKYNDVQGPRDVSKCKQKVEKSLNCFSKVAEPDKDFVTEVELLSHYREEIFHIKKYEGERKDNPNNIELWITPTKIMKRAIIGNVKMTLWESPYEMFHRFKDITDDKTDSKKGKRIMVLRGREPPEMMYCYSDDQVESLFSFVDGYFQLLVNQYDTLLNEMLTSNILTKHVYHGPIEREVALQILTSKGREPGTYLLREHTTQHDCFVLSLIREDDTFAHVVIRQKIDDNKVIFNIDDKRKFQDLNELQEFYKNPDNSAEIKACLQKGLSPKIVVKVPMYTDPVNFRPPPPSRKNHIEINSSISPCLLDSNRMELKHLKNGAFGDVFKSEAQISDERREVIVKRYPTLKSDMLNDVATLLMQIQDDLRILPFVGMSVTGDLFLAFEYLPLGSLEKFLELNRSQVTYGGLLKYLLQITEAVTYLHTKNLIHADLRLSKFFMKDPKTIKLSDCCITWKLSTFKKLDERIFQKRYKHLAPEIFLQQNQLFTQKTDVWAFGLTMWQLFTLVRPFKNYTSTQLMTFFREHMKMNEEPSLNYLNMNILFFCPDKLLNVFTKSLHTREDKRCNMIEIQQAVIDLHRKTPTIHKEKSYFLHDWESEMKQKPVQPPVDPSYYADSAGSLATTNDGGNTTDGSFSDAYTINEGLTSARSDVSNVQEMNGAGYIAKSSRPVLDESSDKESDGDLISPVRPKNADTSSTTDGTTTATVSDEQASSTLDNKSTVDDAESPYLTMSTAGSPSDLVTPAMPVTSKTDERMDVDVTSLTSKDTTLTASSASLPRHGMSRSAPSSPSRPRIFRATSANSNEDSGGDKRGEQDLETASILVDMSQTKLAHKGGEGSTPQGKRPLPNHHLPPGHPSQKQAVLCVPQGYSIVGRVGAPISGQPVRFFNPPPQHPHRSHHFQDGVKRSKALQRPPIKQPPIAPPPQNDDSPLSPPPPPPDSPDSSRRDYSDPPKREIPRDDKTRLFLQEKINKERDRFRGKRSISFNEEFDEYKNSTRKAAKRALLSANPFNLGIKVPDNFLMRPEKRLHPQTKSISAGS
ncbi:uncharacterized protein [Clytia hemisphaerica]|uniref:Tyrosine-protein kinase n=1 Tax=Clytia hemisphaerica TaxID=252671 RepID=A0A7M5WR93_9CNID